MKTAKEWLVEQLKEFPNHDEYDPKAVDAIADFMEHYAKYYHEQQVKSVDLANVGGSYRMLKDGERIQEGDEFIDHQSKWKMSHSINEIYTTKDYYPHRRLK